MSALIVTVVMGIMHGIVCPPTPRPVYDSYGPNKLFVDEGLAVKTVSGKDYLSGVSADRCTEVCDWMRRSCECCNSFAYNPGSQTCYLKKRDSGASTAVTNSQYGWQSYKYWGQVTVFPGSNKYTGGLPQTSEGAPVGMAIGIGYQHAYTANGFNQLANNEGEAVKTATGEDYLANVQPEDCSQACDRVSECDSFAYNPNYEMCYLKKNSAGGKYQTSYNDDGWMTYWKETDWYQKCFCPCSTSYVCIMCGQDWDGSKWVPGQCDAI